MASVVDLKVGNKPQRTDRIYCEKMNVHVRLCRMTACQFYEQCGAKLAQLQTKHKYEYNWAL